MDDTMGNQRLSYVYCTFDSEGYFYIGSRLCPKGETPETDTTYLGSFTHSEFKPSRKTIITVLEDHISSRELESLLLFDLIRDPKCVNKAVFPLTGESKLYPTKDPLIRKKLSLIRKTRPLSPNQISHLERVNSNQKNADHPRADKLSYPFINTETLELFYGTVFDLAHKEGLSLHQVHKAKSRYVNSRFRTDSSNWTLAACDLNLPRFCFDSRLNFRHEGGEEFTGTIKSLSHKTGIYMCHLESLLNGKVRYGWKLNDYPFGE
jgi:hypothetical protein